MNTQPSTSLVKRIAREPLLHFLLLGALLFLLYARVGSEPLEVTDSITVDATQLKVLADQFQRTWMRPPTRQELEGLAEDFIKEEILYREALALGLDQNDLIIRRRMRQKMEFLNADLVEQQTPSDAELQAYMDSNAGRYERPARTSFEQLFFETANDGEARARTALQQTRNGVDPATLGEATLLPPGQQLASAREIARVFGEAFADAVDRAPDGEWSGPWPSTYGLHLLKVTQRSPARQPGLEEVRSEVERDWYTRQRQAAEERFHQALRERYTVSIEWPDTPGTP